MRATIATSRTVRTSIPEKLKLPNPQSKNDCQDENVRLKLQGRIVRVTESGKANDMYWFDTTMLVLLGLGALLGAWSGLIGQIARFVCLGISVYAAVLLHEPVARILQESVLLGAGAQVVRVVAGIVVFVIVFVIVHYTSRLARSGVRAADLESFDRLLGGLFGAAKMALLLGVICLTLASYKHPTTEAIYARSSLAPAFADGMEWIVHVIPEEWKTHLRENVENFREKIGHG